MDLIERCCSGYLEYYIDALKNAKLELNLIEIYRHFYSLVLMFVSPLSVVGITADSLRKQRISFSQILLQNKHLPQLGLNQ